MFHEAEIDSVGIGETQRGRLSGWVRQVEALLAHPAGAPLRRIWHRYNARSLEVTHRIVYVPNLAQDQLPLTILHLTDLHVTAEVDINLWLRRLRYLCVDVIAVTGDLIQDDSGIAESVRFLSALRKRARWGMYVTLGNHDYLDYGLVRLPGGRVVQQRQPNDVARLLAAIDAEGITLLDNLAQCLPGDQPSPIWIVGVGDPYTGHDDMEKALATVPAGAVTVMLAHTPDQLRAAAAREVDVMLGGHTHGGQVRLPVIGPLRTATMSTLRFASGYGEYGGVRCYISRGLGTAGLPVRLLCRPEAAVLTLCAPSRTVHDPVSECYTST